MRRSAAFESAEFTAAGLGVETGEVDACGPEEVEQLTWVSAASAASASQAREVLNLTPS
jgi:hypothetical protein